MLTPPFFDLTTVLILLFCSGILAALSLLLYTATLLFSFFWISHSFIWHNNSANFPFPSRTTVIISLFWYNHSANSSNFSGTPSVLTNGYGMTTVVINVSGMTTVLTNVSRMTTVVTNVSGMITHREITPLPA
jgi:hypothetical protein